MWPAPTLPGTPSAPPSLDDIAAPDLLVVVPPLSGAEMPRIDNPSMRPVEGHVVVVSTPAMDAR